MKPRIGFIGQGWIGRNYSDDFERRGYTVVRYAAEPEYQSNKEKIKDCDMVFIAVPTPTTPQGFDYSIVESVLSLVGKGKIAVIKSTLLPGTTKQLQQKFSDICIMHSPEFLSVATARQDAESPKRNIIGIATDTQECRSKAMSVMSVLPKAPYELITGSTEAEIIKYGRNVLGYVRVMVTNIFYDFALAEDADWKPIQEAMSADPDNGPTYMNPVHKTGRGAGGACFIKDYAAFLREYEKLVSDATGLEMLKAIEQKNVELLRTSNKDLDLLNGVYGV